MLEFDAIKRGNLIRLVYRDNPKIKERIVKVLSWSKSEFSHDLVKIMVDGRWLSPASARGRGIDVRSTRTITAISWQQNQGPFSFLCTLSGKKR